MRGRERTVALADIKISSAGDVVSNVARRGCDQIRNSVASYVADGETAEIRLGIYLHRGRKCAVSVIQHHIQNCGGGRERIPRIADEGQIGFLVAIQIKSDESDDRSWNVIIDLGGESAGSLADQDGDYRLLRVIGAGKHHVRFPVAVNVGGQKTSDLPGGTEIGSQRNRWLRFKRSVAIPQFD